MDLGHLLELRKIFVTTVNDSQLPLEAADVLDSPLSRLQYDRR